MGHIFSSSWVTAMTANVVDFDGDLRWQESMQTIIFALTRSRCTGLITTTR